MKNILLIVDPQNDFITGTLPVPGAKEKMQKLAAYIKEKGNRYDYICVTLDSHTKDHSSFKDNGGIWPEHCVIHTTGWDSPHYLDEVLRTFDVTYYNKGNVLDKEEYSIFNNEEDGYVLARQPIYGCVKLSDVPSKSIGTPEDIENYKYQLNIK